MATKRTNIRLDIKESDHVNHDTSDLLCSRCRNPVKENDIPLKVWKHDGKDMLIYCPSCKHLVIRLK